MIFTSIVVILILNWIVGCVALSLLDRDELILKWVEKSPLPFAAVMVASFWLMVLLHWVIEKGWKK